MLLLLLLLLSFHHPFDGVLDCAAAEKNDSEEEQRLVDRFSLPLTRAINDDGTESSSSETWAKYERRKPGEKNGIVQTYFWSETRGVSQWEDPRLRRVNTNKVVAGGKKKERENVERGGRKEDDDAKTAAETAARIVREAARRKREATEETKM